MKAIAVYNHKGGIGKTVTTINFAYGLAERRKRILIIDMDPQGNASSFCKQYDLSKISVRELLSGMKMPSRCVRRTGLHWKDIDIIPSNIGLREMTKDMLIGGVETLRRAFWALEDKYDYCIVDCPPSVDFLIEVIMAAVDDVIIPMKPDRFSADGLGSVLDIIQDFGGGEVTAGCLFTQFYRHKDAIRSVESVIRTHDVKIYDSVIRRCSAVDHSILVRRPLASCASKSTATLDYEEFTDEYLEKEDKTWHRSRV